MKLVVDANVLFSAAIKDSKTAELLINDNLELYAPEYLFDEFRKHKQTLLEKTHRNQEDFERFIEILKTHINILPKNKFKNHFSASKKYSQDPKDIPYIALALYLDASIWSDDKHFQKQNKIKVYTTTELVKTKK